MFGKILRAAVAAVALMLVLPMNVFAADVPAVLTDDEGITKEYSAEAEDGAVFTLVYRENDDGTLEFTGYRLTAEIVPKDENDFPSEDGKGPYFHSENEMYHANLSKNEVIAEVPRFLVKFPERETGLISIEGVKFYIIDTETQTVRYAGAEIIYEEKDAPDAYVEESEADKSVYVKAEDGADGYLYFYPDETIMGYEIGMVNPDDEYDFPEYKGGTGTYYTDEGQIPLVENQVLCKIEYIVSRDDGSEIIGDKFYIVDYENKTLTYAGHSVVKEIPPVQSDLYDAASADAGLTDSPATGNSYSFITAGIAGLAVMALTKKRQKKIN